MRDSTVFRDLGLYLEREATRLRGLGYAKWAGHLLEDADRLLEDAQYLAESEPPLPSIESLAGIDLGFRPAESEPELERLRRRDAALREAIREHIDLDNDGVLRHESTCQTHDQALPGGGPCDCGHNRLDAALEQGEQS